MADCLGIARQTISKWENGQAVPELNGMIALSNLYHVTMDSLVREYETCCSNFMIQEPSTRDEIISFLLRAKQQTYSTGANKVASTRKNSHDYAYQEEQYSYHDTYLGNEKFSGEEAVWNKEEVVWCMNYTGRVSEDSFSSKFLKDALQRGSLSAPYRGPASYTLGDYHYHCKVDGSFAWFQGYEEIFYQDQKVYECYFHGGEVL